MREPETDYEQGMRSLAELAAKGASPSKASGCNRFSDAGMNVCGICGRMWPKEEAEHPKRCPSCKSTMWARKDIFRHACRRCAHEWISTSESPWRCPSCHSRRWNQDIVKCSCPDCGFSSSYGLEGTAPCRCPSCGSASWRPEKAVCRKGIADEPIVAEPAVPDVGAALDNEDACIDALMGATGVGKEEATIMYLIITGLSAIQIARRLNVSYDAVMKADSALSSVHIDLAGDANASGRS